MTDAGGTNTFEMITNVGTYMLCKLKNDSVDNGETIPLDGPSNSPVVAEDQLIVVGVNNETQETQLGGGTTSVEYDETEMHFTVTDSGASSSVISIWFYLLKN